MKKFWRFCQCYFRKKPSKKEIEIAAHLLTDIEANDRFKSVSEFVFESQKQYFETSKFSLNIWIVLNSGAAVALSRVSFLEYKYYIAVFALGALCSAIGNVSLCSHARNFVKSSIEFSIDTKVMRNDFLKDMLTRSEATYKTIRRTMLASYLLFYIPVFVLILPDDLRRDIINVIYNFISGVI